jgi:predicted Rossmann fold nucleotide-binding protein DprA/Smf involved in DNA uptake
MLYWVWLTQINGIGPKRQRALLERFNTPENVYRASLEDLLSKLGEKSVSPHNGTGFHPHYVEFHRTEKVCCPARLLSHNDHYRY